MKIEIDYSSDATVKRPTPTPGQVFVYCGHTYIAVEIPQFMQKEFTPIASTGLYAVRVDNGMLHRFDSDYNCGTIVDAVLTRPQTDEDD